MGALLADKGYDADYIIAAVGKAQAVIPPRAMRKHQRSYDTEFYKERNLVERMFNKLKHFRRVATRYDKLAVTYLAFIHFAAIFILLKWMSTRPSFFSIFVCVIHFRTALCLLFPSC
jgi:transposase